MHSSKVSVIIRARDEQTSLARCLELLDGQRGIDEPQLIVVDLGSRDRTPAIAAEHGADVLRFAPRRFSFGGALNAGAEVARHPVLVALSAHALPPAPGWLAGLVGCFDDDGAVACACGDRYDPDGRPLTGPIVQDAALARRRPEWGYANAAGAFRADLWRRRPFRADLPGCEDKEWAWHWLHRGHRCVVDPALAVAHDHTHDPLRRIFMRARREARGYAAFVDPPPGPHTPAQLARAWWSDTRWYDSALRARLSPRRAARLLGAYGAASSSATGTPLA